MKIVGLTGGIGSGKTTVAKMFKALNVPIYIADDEAKALMKRSKVLIRQLKALFGEEAYIGNELNRAFLANAIFNDKTLLEKMNAIVHPKVARHFKRWVAKQNAHYVIKEVAILFENGSYKNCDAIITVTAPKEVRIKRVINRDNSNKEKVEAIIKNQWPDAKKIEKSHFVIENIDLKATKTQVAKIHNILIENL
ncbi:dephospho-CoA kinase [Lacinutrix sp. 5H-3-7-4]|uniref:dephospho-CoA kinase n=1 Tax=Lacinutrix sp. (strain 5H-3-7-4) TaxID=983544 RepID=UPI00020A3CAA|nr:dephospho-CoA kinase [Lacinutrix sp. 5H-3-7-4]AEH02794.1 Dephospho-CoA kinase [Lacinutrix sp. 5H-3-7-4]